MKDLEGVEAGTAGHQKQRGCAMHTNQRRPSHRASAGRSPSCCAGNSLPAAALGLRVHLGNTRARTQTHAQTYDYRNCNL